ncbi:MULTISPECIES: lipocalin family protein [Niastella]|uniref:Lipocalin family protein n=1 Tax=Niastella soli TaxID=2821487 RepID=A0ABS3Z3C3_9BACT|nr:lipocalin family protein [Niastella soli]MBO9204660.1 lipocalin family protein [Niastella soli]
MGSTLTNDNVKSWKVNPQGATTYCGQNTVNPAVAMDDTFIFNSNGTFSHRGGTLTRDPNLTNCNDGGDYNNTWSFNADQTSIILGGGIELKIVSLQKSRLIVITPDSKFDLIPN